MKLFDSHCHINSSEYDEDFENVLKNMNAAGVAGAMIVGTNRMDSASVVERAAAYPGLFAAVGVHPHDARECSEETLEYLKELTRHPRVRAWGEVGLDFNRMYSPQADQEKWFSRQLDVADELGLPLIFHERDSEGRFLEMLRSRYSGGRDGVVHCFSGNRAELDAYLEMGLHIGITGVLTLLKRGGQLRTLVPHIPAERLLVETDAPYLTPAPHKNKTRRNEPAFVRATLLKLAGVRGEDPEALAEIIWANTCRLYGIEVPAKLNISPATFRV
ncbi:hydrolase TatD [Desulfonema ishimotonii]|uniref:Hydrolase TatD n=1 Tax=Desulfonema ishimotonii TaxID=45657 RepID=A0A401G1K7_9BACT|nr:TatD family hydrolase [Desulfonema ishimotonii]GBC63102.1 hydrolase TatD [Desulfonema ishimotonii]